jgi:hypothetical protein
MTTWHDIATALAERLYHHARCEQHTPAESTPKTCPFCADRAAYWAYMAKANRESMIGR